MLYAYQNCGHALAPLTPNEPLDSALWVDLYRPLDRQVAQAETLGVEIPTLADMEEIEISNRLYRQDDSAYMTAVLPGRLPDGQSVAMPVTFILSSTRLVTVRHHAPRPFETLPTRAERAAFGTQTPDRLFLSLLDEIVARLADLSEGAGKVVDEVAAGVFGGEHRGRPERLQTALERTGQQADLMSRVRLALLTIERILAFYSVGLNGHADAARLKAAVKAINRDIQALEVHADFLTSRVSLTVDTTLGMINLQQNNTVRILSVVAALFLPPTLIASIYGMNFENMPELEWRWGYPLSLLAMLATALGIWVLLRWRRWL